MKEHTDLKNQLFNLQRERRRKEASMNNIKKQLDETPEVYKKARRNLTKAYNSARSRFNELDQECARLRNAIEEAESKSQVQPLKIATAEAGG